jgi:hypothetical protein
VSSSIAVPATSSKPLPNWRARISVAVGLLAAVSIPLGIALAEELESVELADAIPAIPLAAVAGVAAFVMGTRARRRSEFTLGRIGGSRAGSVGRWLGALGVYLAVTAALAIGFYGLLTLFD